MLIGVAGSHQLTLAMRRFEEVYLTGCVWRIRKAGHTRRVVGTDECEANTLAVAKQPLRIKFREPHPGTRKLIARCRYTASCQPRPCGDGFQTITVPSDRTSLTIATCPPPLRDDTATAPGTGADALPHPRKDFATADPVPRMPRSARALLTFSAQMSRPAMYRAGRAMEKPNEGSGAPYRETARCDALAERRAGRAACVIWSRFRVRWIDRTPAMKFGWYAQGRMTSPVGMQDA